LEGVLVVVIVIIFLVFVVLVLEVVLPVLVVVVLVIVFVVAEAEALRSHAALSFLIGRTLSAETISAISLVMKRAVIGVPS